MWYNIPTNKIEKLEKIIARANKKGANIIFNKGNEIICDGVMYVHPKSFNGSNTLIETPIKVRCVECFVEGTYRINGWSFVGTIEFTENGNIIRLADSSFEGKIPTKYLHTPKICEHCGKIRNRKDTYLICSDEGEFKQVGSSCLLEYTQGLDADVCANIMSSLTKVLDLAKLEYQDDEFFASSYNYSSDCGFDSREVERHAYTLVKAYGYHKMDNGVGTAFDLSNYLFGYKDENWETMFGSLTLVSDEELDKMSAWVNTIDDSEFGYMRNAKLAWLKKSVEYRDFGLVASLVNTYLKEVARQEKAKKDLESKNNTWVGNIGDRITIKVASARVLYTKDNSWKSYYAECTWVMEIIDEEGHTFKWSSSTNNINEGDTIVATIKAHEEYRGIKQTIITRGRVSH